MTLIERLDGKTYDFDDAEIRTLDFLVESPNYVNQFNSVEGARGDIDNGSYLKSRKITVSFFFQTSSVITSSLLRDEIFEFLRSNTPFFITEQRSTNKRWLVKVDSPFPLPTSNYHGKFNVNFIAFKGVAESRKTTQDIQNEGLINDNSWAYGMGLETTDDSELNYLHTSKIFKIFNAGNVEIHPFETDLKIEIKNVQGSTSSFELINRTNDSRFKITKVVTGSDVWLIDGPNIKKNSLLAARDTTKTFISLEPGWNQFEIIGATSATISFDFKFLYL